MCIVVCSIGYSPESFGVLATMVPPCMVVAIEICEMLLAAEQGVTSFGLSWTVWKYRAGLLCFGARELAHHYLGFINLTWRCFSLSINGWVHFQSMRSFALISTSSVIAKLVGADKIVSKTLRARVYYY